MEKQRNIPTLRFPEFNADLENSKLGEITTKISDGLHSTPNYSEDGEFYFINGNNLVNGEIVFSETTKRVSLEEYLKHKKELTNSTILLSINGTIGSLALFRNEKIILGKSACYINLSTKVDKIYIYNLLQTSTISNFFISELTGTTIKNLSLATIKNCSIHIPTLPEQTKIATFLTAVDDRLNQLKKKKTLLEQYKKGVMQKIFDQEIRFKDDESNEFPDWEMKPLGEICRIYDGTHQTPDYKEYGIPFYSVEHITANNFSVSKYISKEVFDNENKRVTLEKGDILMTRIGDIGTARYIDWDITASFYVSLALIKKPKKDNNQFICHFINSDFFQSELHQRTIHVAFPKKINLGEIGNCMVKLPCLAEQTKIANFLSAIDEKINCCTDQISKTDQYKKGLLQKMFC